ncbi:solute carrier organic anion transporter family member 1C1-like isoform X2 [Malaclemys terrapin pileata]|uniref:solute carrier organic anion transporter family member 1C1-like isoform X2 n=1 Tax=Malaclemys terrapin pileata TaxID=2991368 RepID=UPI0023A7AA8B|nr:solute carrier organic anion transporter family member 1C1-like isoform X2 [Malaclemys terrapin pileata]
METRMIPDQSKDNPPFLDRSIGALPVKRMYPYFSKLKIFLGALAFSFFAKGFSGSYMKSMSTQIERRFEISSSVVGIIDGSFEIGNLMVMILVSYLGSKVHRPKVIAAGCLIMSFGTFLSVMPHFLMGRYNYERIPLTEDNSSTSLSACSLPLPLHHPTLDAMEMTRELKNSGTIRSCGMVGPTLGFLLGAFCANLWVDVGVVDLESLTINPKDTRWVGAWWLGLVICAAVSFLASLPFWFLPYSLPKEGEERNLKKLSESSVTIQEDHCKIELPSQPQLKFSEAVKDFLPTLKKLLGNPVFLVYLFLTILQYNSMVGLITFETKFMEQQFNVSVSRAIFLIGVILLPITILGMFLGGFIIKKFKLHITGMAKFGCATFIAAYLLNLLYFTCDCEVLQVAGLTVSYSGVKQSSFPKNNLIASCNSDCSCVLNQWDPVCGDNGITYMTACFAGCKSSIGTGKNMVFHNCSCVQAEGLESGNFSAVLGQCQRESCTKTFPYFLALLSTCALILALGGTPTYMIMFRSVSPDLKSFAVGIDALCGRILGGLPAPIYFGALIDQTCLKWGTKRCGGSGSCRVYDTKAFRNVYLGLIAGLRAGCCFLYITLFILIIKRFQPESNELIDVKSTEVSSRKGSTSGSKNETFPCAKALEANEETCL